ncbi:hypothetical protein HAP47_0011080 [Bradyrhizobium sp. 41S5]|uniref:hypothetical protein n=1 Tax=Bradyrhizobium sp. 41S5 TaxID=1404443 RepID=UPI00156B1C5A|nr:hypothetical protein [Bradyrhizobium sp. 41S5]UFX47173.1 hypothetical protein HAP47_0011080 [Bradyrhizobium sp. 41S5]
MSELARSTHDLRSPSGTMMPQRYFKCFVLLSSQGMIGLAELPGDSDVLNRPAKGGGR